MFFWTNIFCLRRQCFLQTQLLNDFILILLPPVWFPACLIFGSLIVWLPRMLFPACFCFRQQCFDSFRNDWDTADILKKQWKNINFVKFHGNPKAPRLEKTIEITLIFWPRCSVGSPRQLCPPRELNFVPRSFRGKSWKSRRAGGGAGNLLARTFRDRGFSLTRPWQKQIYHQGDSMNSKGNPKQHKGN